MRLEFIEDPKTGIGKIRRPLTPEDWSKLEKHLAQTKKGASRLVIYQKIKNGQKLTDINMSEMESYWHKDLDEAGISLA